MRRKNMSINENIRQKIAELEQKLQNQRDDTDSIKREIDRLKIMAFEEDIKHTQNQQLLKG